MDDMTFKIAKKTKDCIECGFCTCYIDCSASKYGFCSGCGICVDACPYFGRALIPDPHERRKIQIIVDGESFEISEHITVKAALESLGYKVHAPCKSGGCFECAVIIDGVLKQSCITPVYDGMKIDTETSQVTPLRIVSGFQGHMVGGVGTPHQLKKLHRVIEVACFGHGCILRCPTCQNWEVTYSSVDLPLTPRDASKLMTHARKEFRVDRMAISGGEATLNSGWLIKYFRELKMRNRDERARLHLDTNGVLLTPGYIDDLYGAGMSDIGVDLKGIRLETFMRISGLEDSEYAKKLLDAAWKAVRYIVDNYFDKIFIGIGIPYNRSLIQEEELYRMGESIASMRDDIQVGLLDYRGEFRMRKMKRPSFDEMLHAKRILEDAGLKCVIAQTERGYIGPL